MGEAVVTLDGVAVRRHRTVLLGPVSLTVERGEFIGVVGPNGAGKTTLLRVIAGIGSPSLGSVAAFGQPSGSRAFRSTVRRRIGVLFQHHDFLPDLPFTVEDVVMFGRVAGAGLGRRIRPRDMQAAEQALESLDLGALRKRLYRDLSGGERQKTHLARLVAQDADLILLDEPSAGLDLAWQERLTLLTERVFDGGRRTIMMVTHEIDRLPSCCSRALLLKDGQLRHEDTPQSAFTSARLSELYGCDMHVVPKAGRWHAFATGEGAA